MTKSIHPSSVIEDGAEIGEDCVIGPFCHIGPNVRLGAGARLHSHVVIAGHTTIGEGARIFPFASVGHEPQDLKYQGEVTTLVVGRNCVIREGVTLNPGTAGDASTTIIGDNCVFLANAHVAHDCVLGNNIIFSNAAMVAGHCKVGDNVIFGGGAGVHQFCRIGRNAFIGGMAGVDNDVIPYGIALGNRAYLGGINIVGMKRAGIARESIHAARATMRHLFSGEVTVMEAAKSLPENISNDPIAIQIAEFVLAGGDNRSLCTPRSQDDMA